MAKRIILTVVRENMDNSFFLKKAIQIAEITTIPFYLVGGPLVGFWIGGLIDQNFGTTQFRTIFIIVGAFTGMRESWRIIRTIAERQENKNSNSRS